ncbi:hypothetical protein OUZ56_018304 [Daphnia magna]|uniref:Uncharacterized protein n=1 Tax=Daphnia magna TaxID=35525 RepID=A0ABQ9Z8G9_9CRUS|nr:hypothetical protein OUZ56_018304 [Daphnia magna]
MGFVPAALKDQRARNNYRKCRIDKIIAPNGTCLSAKEDMSAEIVDHFKKNFKTRLSPDTLAENSDVFAGPSGDQANSQAFRTLWSF